MTPRVALALVLLAAGDAAAVRFRRPFHDDRGISAAFDNARGGGLRDYACNGNTYDDHTGTDFRISFSEVVAMAPGTVIATFDGCADYGSLGNTCGGRCGNHVRMRFDDGHVGLYCHMKRGSLSVGVGNRVACGQRLGTSASSGSSTGPHLHVGWYRNGTATDPYAGQCSNSSGNWVQQRGYLQAPGTACEQNCECSPGQVDTQGCGRCGTRRRTCASSCEWGGFGACAGEGPCAPGQVEESACCDCGRTRRTCAGSCTWSGWSECAGPDPAGSCATGLPGACGEGRPQCVRGCLACTQTTFPSPETCNDRDDDCDGPVDEDSPRTLGARPPAYAAVVVDASFPRWLPAGARTDAWVAFRNVGRETWRAGEVWLRADAPASGHASLLAPPEGWAAHDVPAVLAEEVAPGATAVFRFPLAARAAEADVAESFSLVAPSGAIACPEASLAVSIASVRAAPPEPESVASPSPVQEEGCATVGSGTLAALAALLLHALRRPRRPVAR